MAHHGHEFLGGGVLKAGTRYHGGPSGENRDRQYYGGYGVGRIASGPSSVRCRLGSPSDADTGTQYPGAANGAADSSYRSDADTKPNSADGGTTSTPAMNEPANGAAALNANPAVGPESVVPSGNPPVVGENEPAIGGLFGDQTPSACEFCGNGNCLPPKWAVTNNIAVITMSRPQDRTLGVNSLPAGPLAAGTTSYTNTATGPLSPRSISSI